MTTLVSKVRLLEKRVWPTRNIVLATPTCSVEDVGRRVTITNASAITLTIPTNAAVSFPVGQELEYIQGGAGAITATADVGVTLTGAVATAAAGDRIILVKTDVNTWFGAPGLANTAVAADVAALKAKTRTVRAVTGTSDTLVLADAGKVITGSNANAITFTIPANAAVAFAVGTQIEIQQIGAGQVIVQGDAGVSVGGTAAASIRTTFIGDTVTLTKLGTDSWQATATRRLVRMTFAPFVVAGSGTRFILGVPQRGVIELIGTVLQGAITTGNAACVFDLAGTPITHPTFTITQSGSAAGDVDSVVPSGARTADGSAVLGVTVTGGGGTNTAVPYLDIRLA